jgi:hypothetical protein
MLTFKLKHVRTPKDYAVLTSAIDQYLDEWYSIANCATEWDADKWGFNTDTWMVEERKTMSKVPMIKGWDGRWYEPRQR